MGHPARLRIAWRLYESPCAVAVLERELDLRQPGLSQYLTALRDSGVAYARREGKQVVYELCPDAAGLMQRLAGEVPLARNSPRPSRAPECGIFAIAGSTDVGETQAVAQVSHPLGG